MPSAVAKRKIAERESKRPLSPEARRRLRKSMAELRARFGGRTFSDSTEIIRKMRDAEESIDYIDAADFIRKLRDAEDNC